jgi:hypothetical protein
MHIISYENKQSKVNKNDNKNNTKKHHKTICLLEKHLAFGAYKKTKKIKTGVGGN